MGEHILPGTPPVSITLRESARARRLSLRVSGIDGRVTLTVPRGVTKREAVAFATEKSDWIRGHLQSVSAPQRITDGAQVPYQGRMLRVASRPRRGIAVEGDTLFVGPASAQGGARVQAWLKHQARAALVAASDYYARELRTSYGRITLRDTRSRWGSCTSDGNLMYSWRLIMAPPAVLDYVAAHETAHLLQMNHSRAYWKLVAAICPDYELHRRWLRDHGTRLHRYQFTE